ncbi:hypothetical protein [Pseudovibrio sp. POLY-S9]|uniref:hypothetical protein n=1 Tax=Pseudovibrio sp. POLY-S9 TaxID=1576596 RepID=UPI000AD830E4|nr:hypothetical protein [Pseudovibrio sp. POLY-S9]
MSDPFAPIKSIQTSKPKREQPQKVIVMPVPDGAPEPPSFHGKLGVPSQCWTYRDAAGEVLGYVYRFDEAGAGKSYRPLCLFQVAGQMKWR